jgi:hypothetical protein
VKRFHDRLEGRLAKLPPPREIHVRASRVDAIVVPKTRIGVSPAGQTVRVFTLNNDQAKEEALLRLRQRVLSLRARPRPMFECLEMRKDIAERVRDSLVPEAFTGDCKGFVLPEGRFQDFVTDELIRQFVQRALRMYDNAVFDGCLSTIDDAVELVGTDAEQDALMWFHRDTGFSGKGCIVVNRKEVLLESFLLLRERFRKLLLQDRVMLFFVLPRQFMSIFNDFEVFLCKTLEHEMTHSLLGKLRADVPPEATRVVHGAEFYDTWSAWARVPWACHAVYLSASDAMLTSGNAMVLVQEIAAELSRQYLVDDSVPFRKPPVGVADSDVPRFSTREDAHVGAEIYGLARKMVESLFALTIDGVVL